MTSLKTKTLIALAVTSSLSAAKPVVANTAGKTLKDIEVIQVHGKVSDADLVVDQQFLEKLQANDLADIFRNQAEVSVGGSNSIAQKIYIRGLEDTMLNVSIDGALQAGYLFHHQGRLSLEPELLKQVDVVAGAGDATSGSGALGGALRFVTKNPEDLLEADQSFGSLFKAGYYSNSKGYKVSNTVYGRVNDTFSGMLTLSEKDTDNIKDGNGNELAFSQTEQQVGFLKLVANIDENQSISLSHDVRRDDGERLLRAHWHQSRKNPALPQESHRDTTTLNYNYSPENNALLDLNFSAYKTVNSIQHQHILKGNTWYAEYDSIGFDLRNTSQIDAHKIVYGLDFRDDTATLENVGAVYNLEGKETGQVSGVYVQDYFQINEAVQLSAGLRFDDYQLTDDNGHDLDSSGISPNINLSYQFNDELSVYTGYAEAFRGQKVKELFVLGYYDNDTNLKAEQAKNYELGFKYIADNFVVSGDVYSSVIENAVSNAKNFAGLKHNVIANVGDVENSGFNLRTRYYFSQGSIGASYNQSNPEWKNHINPVLNGTPLSDQDWSIGTTTGDTWVIDAQYTPINDLELGWSLRAVEKLTDTGIYIWEAEKQAAKPGYQIHDLTAKWYVNGSDNLTVNFAVKNVFDKFYIDQASYAAIGAVDSGLAEPGRDFRLTVNWTL